MGIRRNPQGPLGSAELVQVGAVDGVVFWDRTTPAPVPPLDTDEDYIIQMSDRPDLLSQRKLGVTQFGWVIMERNNDIVPFEVDMRIWPNDFVPGYTIKLPSRTSIHSRGIAP